MRDYVQTLIVEESPQRVFDAINDVRGWWCGQIEGTTDQLGAEFTYRYGDLHCSRQKLTELVPGRRIVWHVLEAELSFVEDSGEWSGTDIIFEIARTGSSTEIRFTHRGLHARRECYQRCSSAWSTLLNGSLRRLISTGEPQPDIFAQGTT